MASPAKLFSCVQSHQICRSPLNRSPAKLQYSFSRDERFKSPKIYCDKFYQTANTKMTRHTSFGYGKKTDLDIGKHPHNIIPAPTSYNINSFVQTDNLHKRGVSTHIGRQLTTPRSYINLQAIKVPGPGRYDQYRQNITPKWSMRPITNPQLFQKTTVLQVPGPGQYNFNQSISQKPNGKFYMTKYSSSKSKVWNPPRSQRFYKSGNQVPGAGNYNPFNDLSDQGKYVLSQNKGFGKRKLDIEHRGSFVQIPSKVTKTPGPGSYRLPSDFGQYDQIKLNKSQAL